METLTEEEFKKKYGVIAASQFDPTTKKDSLFSEIKQAFSQGIGTIGQGINEAKPVGGQGVGGLISGVGKIVGGTAQAVTSPLAPALNRTVAPAIDAIGAQIGKIPAVQKFAASPAGEATSKVAETVGNYANAAGLVAGGIGGAKGASGLVSKVGDAVENAPKLPSVNTGAASKYVSGAIRDVIPTKQSLIDHNLAKALDLTPGDLSNIEKSTGNQIGPWLSENNLIGLNKENTQGLISSFFKQNYDTVRGEIAKVDKTYKPSDIPRYQDTLKVIAAETQGRLGMEKVNSEIASLLQKEDIQLKDVQRVKELLDEHFNLYKITGDIASGVTKEGLANVRDEIKTFIEKEVQDATGADIRQMNNNVSTARSLSDAIDTRSTRGLTRANITTRDWMMGTGLSFLGGPFIGLAAVFVKKIATSPTARLRFARYLDGLNDAEKFKISESIQKGDVPKEVQKVVGE